ncbi:MerR family transcriptional regulator [Nocardiopsis sp. N85]|uniref:MerR family transcriptional regulator n=1 Tax=Nocardiopsis sp. N85 TaxID=3029400 RepID=UPI00237FB243|nr:MerR family transcriptional regulator [Nocardiopsis sp. N85]MDE3722112.1 MerR family transcriptional regulator [Nocardiopsis sp. N85]
MEWTIRELATRAGVTGRTLRHYDRVGLLPPSRVGDNGHRHYGPGEVARLRRILLLRRTGMGLAAIAEVLAEEVDECDGLRAHIAALEEERDRIDRDLRAVRHVLTAREAGAEPCADVLLEGFNDRYRDEVTERWGEDAFRAGHEWWHAKSLREQQAWKRDTEDLVAAWVAARGEGVAPVSARAQGVAARHVEWLSGIPGTPTAEGDRERAISMVTCLADTYVENPAFIATYQGAEGAAFVRDALHEYARTRM